MDGDNKTKGYGPKKFIKQAFNINLNKVHVENENFETVSFLPPENQYFVTRQIKEPAKLHHVSVNESDLDNDELLKLISDFPMKTLP